jgi:hypothetical protein
MGQERARHPFRDLLDEKGASSCPSRSRISALRQPLSARVKNASIRRSALIELLPGLHDMPAEAGPIGSIVGEIADAAGNHIAADPQPSDRGIGAAEIMPGLAILEFRDDEQIEVAVRLTRAIGPAAEEPDLFRIDSADQPGDNLGERPLFRFVRSAVGMRARDPGTGSPSSV